ncbi:MAG: dynamin family protein [Candidatus Eremiobacteraeota bacterium]|nr:dynamin family protein [Candidatus Eremiobacteraeota bacterium]
MSVDRDAMRRYETARDEIASLISKVEPALPAQQRAAMVHVRERLERSRFVLAVVGEFSSGKSFLLNALLGKYRYENASGTRRITGLLATDINPSTATITELDFGADEAANAYYEDGRIERIPLDRLSKFIAVGKDDTGKMHDATADEGGAPSRVRVTVDSPFLQRGFTVADTPGLASINPAHRRATLQFLPGADAVLYLIDTQQPFSEGDAAFLGIIRQHIDSIFILQTKIDLWEQTQADGRRAWESAHDRISSLAAIHAPGTYVYALSARQFVEGSLERSSDLIVRSRFQKFLDALDASLIATTGRARLRRAAEQTAIATAAAIRTFDQNAAMLALEPAELEARYALLVPQFERLSVAIGEQSAAIEARAQARSALSAHQGTLLADQTESTLTQAFDTADVARLRDRARLHVLVDRTFADVVGDFAREIAAQTLADVQAAAAAARAVIPLEFSLNDAAARAFGVEPGTGLWADDLAAAISAAIVLAAIGGPAIALVSDIAARFAAAPPGGYMKRELTADLRAAIFPNLRIAIAQCTDAVSVRLQTIYNALAGALQEELESKRDAELASVERAQALNASKEDRAARRAAIEADIARLAHTSDAVAAAAGAFLSREPEIAAADPGHEALRRTNQAAFDDVSYRLGLRPQRWRVAVLGALRRGKSSLINSFAGTRVLADEDAGALTYPVHVRYGPAERAYALGPGGNWSEVEIESALQEATRNPVLIETPWSLPRELVFVHVPAFDTGENQAQEIAVLAASRASEVLCLFSRQLSDRELDLYERVAELGKPVHYVHTIADNETAAERRQVIELATSYLAGCNILARRIFTVSTLDYAQAKREARAPSPWNELDALSATLVANAEAHMERLARLESASGAPPGTQAVQPLSPPVPEKTGGFAGALARLFGGHG